MKPTYTTWYATNRIRFGSDGWIVPVEVEKATEHFITVVDGGPFGVRGRVAKRSELRDYFPTWEQARNSLLTRYSTRAEQLRRELAVAEGYIAELNALSEPQP